MAGTNGIASVAMIADMYPEQERATPMGIFVGRKCWHFISPFFSVAGWQTIMDEAVDF